MRQLDEKTLVSGQIQPADLAEIKAQGVTMVVNNRPDGEDAGQPSSDEIEAAARAAGLDYRHIPLWRGPGPAEVEKMREAMAECGEGRMLAFCRSGTRSAFAWAVAQAENGKQREEIEKAAAQAGYDISPVAHLL